MRIFRQAFEQLGGSRTRTKSDPRQQEDMFIVPPEEYFKQDRPQPLTRQFFTMLSTLETKIVKECTVERVNQVVQMYQQCIEFYDSRKDDIKYYFVDKIQNALYEMQQISCLKTKLVTEVQSPVNQKINNLSPIPIEEDEHYIRNKKKEKSIKLAIQEQMIQVVKYQPEQVQGMVNEYHEKLDQHTSMIKKSVNQQEHQFNERLRKRSINKKSLSRCNSSGILEQNQ
ncbi:unnamed protein product [Paramecium sonneborni]|uniref:Uncharacterized protein n=1 Tax=Paramecium sonneborni TaxID=65129 RepID=A0A8S1QWL5_9CILI|nr:unnamed protein product [Paramecium sonneborni]